MTLSGRVLFLIFVSLTSQVTSIPTCCHSDNRANGCGQNWVVGEDGQSCREACSANGGLCVRGVHPHELSVWPYEHQREDPSLRGVAPLQEIVCNYGVVCTQVQYDANQIGDGASINPSYKDGICYAQWFDFQPESAAELAEWCAIDEAQEFPDSGGMQSTRFSGLTFDCDAKKAGYNRICRCDASSPIAQCTSDTGGELCPTTVFPLPDSIAEVCNPGTPTTESPTMQPTEPPTSAPTSAPTSPPTSAPTSAPTSPPTSPPTSAPTSAPTTPPTSAPTSSPNPVTCRAVPGNVYKATDEKCAIACAKVAPGEWPCNDDSVLCDCRPQCRAMPGNNGGATDADCIFACGLLPAGTWPCDDSGLCDCPAVDGQVHVFRNS